MLQRVLVVPLALALCLVLVGGGIYLGARPDLLPPPVRDALAGGEDDVALATAVDRIESDYVRPVDRSKLVDAAIDGMVSSLDDRFSAYFDPSRYDAFRDETDARFVGIGVSVQRERDGLRVNTVYEKSPARDAKLRVGELIFEAGGKQLGGLPDGRATELVRGKEGSSVVLGIRRGEGDGAKDRRVRVKRAKVSIPVVDSKLRRTANGQKIAQVAVSTFSTGVHGLLRQELEERKRQGAKGVILDLRGNGGGLLEEARLVSSQFIADGPIVSTRGRAVKSRTLMATGNALKGLGPVVVLVDRGSASASEIVAGALRDRVKARLVGERTFGKGVFQNVTGLPNDGALDLTVGRYFLPSGKGVGQVPVKPGTGLRPNVRASDDPKTPGDEAVRAGLRALEREQR